MEKKNTVLLTVIAVATLLVAVVGATFAYFTATAEQGGAGSQVNTTTGTVQGATLQLNTLDSNAAKLDYPGGIGYAGATVTVNNVEGDNKTYELAYKLKLSYTNMAATTLKYYVYDVDSITLPSGCQLKEDTTSEPGNTLYYYTTDEIPSKTATACTVLNHDDAIAAGDMATTDADGTTVTIETTNDLTLRTAATEKYFVVVEYPNTGDQSTGDMAKAIKFNISGATTPVQKVVTSPETP